jgi:hypothetical protein
LLPISFTTFYELLLSQRRRYQSKRTRKTKSSTWRKNMEHVLNFHCHVFLRRTPVWWFRSEKTTSTTTSRRRWLWVWAELGKFQLVMKSTCCPNSSRWWGKRSYGKVNESRTDLDGEEIKIIVGGGGWWRLKIMFLCLTDVWWLKTM